MHYQKLRNWPTAAWLLMLTLSSSVLAQVTTGSILGTVKDNTGAAVKKAKVTVTEVGISVTPGQVGENQSGALTFNPRASANFNALGHQANSNGWLIDGNNDNEYTFKTVILQPTVAILSLCNFLSVCSHNVRINWPNVLLTHHANNLPTQ
jgi:hypothetical protein